MEGVWKGTGWIKTNGIKQQFRETETVIRKLSGSVIQIEAFGTEFDDSNIVVNDALGIVSFDQTSKKYRLRIFQSDGSFVEANASVIRPAQFEFNLQIPGAYVKYVIEVVDKKWIEKAYRSVDKTTWEVFFEMILLRE